MPGSSNQRAVIQERIVMSSTGVRFEEFFKWKVTFKPECHTSEKSNLLQWCGFRFPGL